MDKEWLFQENLRLKALSDELEQREKALKEEEKNFEQQKRVLEIGFKKLAADKEAFAMEMKKEKARIQEMQYEAESDHAKVAKVTPNIVGPGFFCGTTGANSLKKRYKELMKIYHPDNKYGDSFTVACINREYELLKEKMAKKERID